MRDGVTEPDFAHHADSELDGLRAAVRAACEERDLQKMQREAAEVALERARLEVLRLERDKAQAELAAERERTTRRAESEKHREEYRALELASGAALEVAHRERGAVERERDEAIEARDKAQAMRDSVLHELAEARAGLQEAARALSRMTAERNECVRQCNLANVAREQAEVDRDNARRARDEAVRAREDSVAGEFWKGVDAARRIDAIEQRLTRLESGKR